MIKLINKKIKTLEEQLKETKVVFEEHDNSEDMHRIENLEFTINQFKSFRKEMKAKLAGE